MSRRLLKEMLEKVLKIPRRVELLGGQNYSYIRLEEIKDLIEGELEKPDPDPDPTGYTGVGLNLISSEDFEKLQTGMKLLYDTPLYEHPPAQPAQEPEPDYWHVVGKHGESIFVASFKEACHDHINDALIGASYYPEAEVTTWVVRPLWSKPQTRAEPQPDQEPELLTDDEIIQLAAERVTFSWDENDIKFARAIEQAVWSKMK